MWKLRIKEVIDSYGLSIEEVANKCGVSVPTVYRWRTLDNVTLDKLDEIANSLGCRIKDLFIEPERDDTGSKMFIWDNDRESQLRRLIRCIGGINADLSDLRNEASKLLEDSTITEN